MLYYKAISKLIKQKTPLAITIIIILCYIIKFSKHSFHQNTQTVELQPTKLNKAFQEPIRGEPNIFFVETFCFEQPSEWYLNPRQACAIESAARWNPAQKVYLLHTCDMNLSTLPQHTRELLLYPNVWFWKVNATQFVKGTVIEDWWMEGGIKKSNFPVVHASDVFRLLALWKYGGTYMDLDVVVLKPLTGLSNFIGAESRLYLANGIMNFKAAGFGHVLVQELLVEIERTFNGDTWGYNGPELVTRWLNKRCNVTEPRQMTTARCKGFNVLPPNTFYPIPWAFWKLYFLHRDATTGFPLSLTKDSVAVHVWNKYSVDLPIDIGSNQTYAILAAQNCPRAYYHSESMPVF